MFKIQNELGKTLFGNLFFLRNCNFTNTYNNIYVNRYFEKFNLGTKYIGKFNCNIIKNGFKNSDVWSYESNIEILDKHHFNKIVLLEDCKIYKRSISSKEPPSIYNVIKYNNRTIRLDEIPDELYTLLSKKDNKDIIDVKVW